MYIMIRMYTFYTEKCIHICKQNPYANSQWLPKVAALCQTPFWAGDLGRWREGGVIDLLGRKDFQARGPGLTSGDVIFSH